MKFTPSLFAVLAVFVANGFVVNASPIPRTDLVVREPSMVSEATFLYLCRSIQVLNVFFQDAAANDQQLTRRAYHQAYLEARDFLVRRARTLSLILLILSCEHEFLERHGGISLRPFSPLLRGGWNQSAKANIDLS